ncbi:DnaJ (Hsp40), sub C, member 11 [Pseudogymnoascus destructans]|uniref:J domain-containing protein n=2 Tax=Pseudogymnoascus destructans TaxID=655981 RepID=L8G1G0_PSED2|nr:DnaJ (Hsp40), sub C, member 11 [Pseudogymnoascus destructans]ELR06543.1 hypothetical protein GMDG_02177 [Pseudogymnoascus destructans 20631-21]OAF56178.1 DnaJ (Hsp40), sub C, member 11 [Pseudogymnoascus destructans]
MADRPRRDRGDRDRVGPTAQPQSAVPRERRRRRPADSNPSRAYDGAQIPVDLRSMNSMNSRYSLNEQFASSRQEFEFGDDDEDESDSTEPTPNIPPAPTAAATPEDDEGESDSEEPTPDTPPIPTAATAGPEEDSFEDISDAEIRQLLQANKDEFVDHYTLLGLSRDPPPTATQVKAAYHRLSLAFHPDKQPHHLKGSAERHFARLRLAYETLSEPRKRVIYDIEGEEGVRNEYGEGGAMGRGGESKKQLSSVKAMSAEEFKAWFLGVLHRRERRAIEALIDHHSNFKIGLNASDNFVKQTRVVLSGNVEIPLPNQLLRVDEIGFESSFTLPLPKLGRLFEIPVRQLFQDRLVPLNEDDDETEPNDWADTLSPSVPKLTITGGVSGEVQDIVAVLPRGDTSLPPYFNRHYAIVSQQIGFGIALHHAFPELLGSGNSNSIASLLQGTGFRLETSMLPHPASTTLILERPVCIIPDTTPFNVSITTTVKDSLILRPPEIFVIIQRALGLRGNPRGYFVWASGEKEWPSSISQSLAGAPPLNLPYAVRWVTQGRGSPLMKLGADWNFDGEAAGDNDKPGTAPFGTSVYVLAHTESAYLSVSYFCNVFSRYDEPPVRSRISNSGEVIPHTAGLHVRKSRGILLEVEAKVGLPAILSASISGKRRIGTFTCVGLSVGVAQNLGLYCSFSWSRLKQNISFPVALIPLEDVTTSAILLAVGIPWALYTTLEFAVIRPRIRRKRRRLLKSQRAKLKLNIAKKREQAEQVMSLMVPSVEHRQAQARRSGGLVILSASYGTKGKDGVLVDVTTALASLVDADQLNIPRSVDRNKLTGFWDPAPLSSKVLVVKYLFGGKEHFVEVGSDQSLIIPSRAHVSTVPLRRTL